MPSTVGTVEGGVHAFSMSRPSDELLYSLPKDWTLKPNSCRRVTTVTMSCVYHPGTTNMQNILYQKIYILVTRPCGSDRLNLRV